MPLEAYLEKTDESVVAAHSAAGGDIKEMKGDYTGTHWESGVPLDADAFAGVVEASGDALVVLDAEERFVYANAPALALLTQASGELLGRRITDVFPEIVDTVFWPIYLRATGERSPLTVEDYYAPRSLWFEIRTLPLGDLLYVHFRDTTAIQRAAQDAVQARQTLVDLQAHLETALAVGDIATWTWDADSNRVVADANLARLFSLTEEATASGEIGAYFQAIHPEDINRVRRAVSKLWQNGGDYEVDFRVVLPGGAQRWLVARGQIKKDPGGQITSVPGMIVNITERVQRERRERFLAELADRARSLTDPAVVIADATASVGRFLGVDRCTFADIDLDADTCRVHPDYRASESVLSIAGVLPVSDFGPFLTAEFQAGRPIAVDDVRGDPLRVPPANVAAYESIGIRAHVTVPLVHSARLVSTIAVHSRMPRHWKPEELELLREVVERTWLTVELARQQAERRRVEEQQRLFVERERNRLSDIFMRVPAFIAMLRGPQHRFELANPHYDRLVGHREILGKPVAEALPEVVAQGFVGLLDEVYQTGVPFVGTDARVMLQRYPSGPEKEHFLDFTYQPIFNDDGSVSGILVHGVDLTERKRLEQERERLLIEARVRAEREALINRIGAAVRSTVEPEDILRAAVSGLGQGLQADRCYFVRYNQTRDAGTIAPEWYRDGVGLMPIAGITRRMSTYAVNRDASFKAGLWQVVNDTMAFAPADAAPLLALNVRALLRVPIEVGDQMTAIGVAMSFGPREWTDDDVRLVENVAVLLRSALESAYIQQRERRVSERLQEALMPSVPAQMPGLSLASYYRPALDEATVGGDFFDVFPVSEDSTALVVADLSGKGLAAASQVATVRNMLRYALYAGDSVAESVTKLHRTLCERDLLTGFATLFAGIYDHSRRTVTYVNCGQEPGLVWRSATGGIELLTATGPVLGGFQTASGYEEWTIELAPGDVLSLFTDGLTEVGPTRKNLLEVEGVSRLFQACCNTSAGDPQNPQTVVDDLIEGVDNFACGGIRDDMALLVAVVAS